MPHGLPLFFRRLRALLAATLLLAVSQAWADAYSEVRQLVSAGQLEQALGRADQYLAGQPRDPQMRFLRGVILTQSGRTPEAIGAFERLTQDYPELPEPYNNLAVLYAQQNELDKARTALEMAVRTNPGYAVAHENLGDIYVRMAGQSYGRAAQVDPAAAATVAPKLALVRELLEPRKAPSRRPAAPPRN
ncbi:tetratricopeptide repeat protein [Ramlibacter rhizophilus]|uniref:Tetratricopeptide repeat protein n=1 Tax=Ramlibacter rhizophilus TaxID=1781167 RepID=A0A4Z0BZ81_9BURK|nr:tetratricopeptide repeat protein [Ramlibacter rhizophilus]TFZ04667.1 tetratricopeptide repeat protein [Ramlibacter rhizophilus]